MDLCLLKEKMAEQSGSFSWSHKTFNINSNITNMITQYKEADSSLSVSLKVPDIKELIISKSDFIWWIFLHF